jgi:hypothetical protein
MMILGFCGLGFLAYRQKNQMAHSAPERFTNLMV